MVAQSLEIRDSVVNDCVVPKHLKVSMTPKVKIKVKYGGKKLSDKSKDSTVTTEVTPMSSQRRSSSRIQAKQKEVEEIQLRRKEEELVEKEKSGEVEVEVSPVKSKKRVRRSPSRESVVKEVVEEKETTEKKKEEVVVEGKPTKKKKSASDEKRELMEVWNEKMVAETENAGGALSDKSSTAKVKETIRTFNKHYLHLVQVNIFFFFCFL